MVRQHVPFQSVKKHADTLRSLWHTLRLPHQAQPLAELHAQQLLKSSHCKADA
jgi:hypothetical protein